MISMNTRFITRTAILLALAVVFQIMGRFLLPFMGPNSNFVVGPLVNACLLVSAAAAGIWSGTAVAVISPFTAVLTGAAIPLPFVPFIAIGNFLLVLMFHLLRRNRIAGILTGAVLKFGLLYAVIVVFLGIFQVKPKVAGVLLFSFSWPQLVTALVGGLVAMLVLKALGKSVEQE